MLTLSIISILCLVAIVTYLAYFLITYKRIPASISQTAEFPHCYYGFQTVICFIFGYLQYYFPAVYPYADYGFSSMLLNAGCAGLALAGYFSYSPWEETKRDMTIHQYGSLAGGSLLMLFYAIFREWWLFILIVLAVCVTLGYFIQGNGWNRQKDNSITFWVEIGLIVIVGTDLVQRFIALI